MSKDKITQIRKVIEESREKYSTSVERANAYSKIVDIVESQELNEKKLKDVISEAYSEYLKAYQRGEDTENLKYPRNEYRDVTSYMSFKVREYLHLDKIRDLAIAYQLACEYDCCPDMSMKDEVVDNSKIEEELIEEVLYNYCGLRTYEIAQRLTEQILKI